MPALLPPLRWNFVMAIDFLQAGGRLFFFDAVGRIAVRVFPFVRSVQSCTIPFFFPPSDYSPFLRSGYNLAHLPFPPLDPLHLFAPFFFFRVLECPPACPKSLRRTFNEAAICPPAPGPCRCAFLFLTSLSVSKTQLARQSKRFAVFPLDPFL